MGNTKYCCNFNLRVCGHLLVIPPQPPAEIWWNELVKLFYNQYAWHQLVFNHDWFVDIKYTIPSSSFHPSSDIHHLLHRLQLSVLDNYIQCLLTDRLGSLYIGSNWNVFYCVGVGDCGAFDVVSLTLLCCMCWHQNEDWVLHHFLLLTFCVCSCLHPHPLNMIIIIIAEWLIWMPGGPISLHHWRRRLLNLHPTCGIKCCGRNEWLSPYRFMRSLFDPNFCNTRRFFYVHWTSSKHHRRQMDHKHCVFDDVRKTFKVDIENTPVTPKRL